MAEPLLTRYLLPLLGGRRCECFSLIHTALDDGARADQLIRDLIWPSMAQVTRLYNADRIDTAHENMAARINRTVADQLQVHLDRAAPNGKRLLVACADEPREELGAQMVADLFQSDGWEVYFVGGGVPEDEILKTVGALRPAAMLIFGTQPQNVPAARRLVDLIREVNACPTMNVIVSGGVFNRADGLWREVGADVFADTADDLLAIVNELEPRVPGTARFDVVKKRRRRRKTPVVV